MKIKNLFLLAALGLMASATLTSCEDVLGHWEKPSPNPITPGGGTPVTPEEIYAFSLRNMADDADITAGIFKLTDQNGTEIAYATSDGKYTIKSGELSSVTTLWLEATTATGKYIAKATKEELSAIAEAGKLKMATIGDVILSDGKFAAPSSTETKVAMIAYLGSSTGVDDYTHGLALALSDVSANTLSWDNTHANNDSKTAAGWCSEWNTTKTITGGTWMLPSKDQWNNMITAAGGYGALRNGFSGIAGADNLESEYYWSSTEYSSSHAWICDFYDGNWNGEDKSNRSRVRACLAF